MPNSSRNANDYVRLHLVCGERGSGKPRRRVVIAAAGEPAGQHAKVGRTIAATASPFVERGDGAQQLRDGGPGPSPQQFGLRRLVASAEKPAAQSSPALPPGLLVARPRVGLVLGVARRRVACLARSDLPNHFVDMRIERDDETRDGIGAPDEVADESLEVFDQPSFVVRHLAGVGLMQVNVPRHASHEGLRILGQAFENAHKIAHGFVDLGDVGFGGAGESPERLEPAGDIFERHRLELGAAVQGLREDYQGGLDGLAAVRQPVKKPCAIEVAEARYARRVRVRFEIAPVGELGQREIDLFETRRCSRPSGFGQDLVRPQLEPILSLRGGEDVHDAAIERRLVHADVPEQLCGVARDLHEILSLTRSGMFMLCSSIVKRSHLVLYYIRTYVFRMTHLSIRDLQKISGERISALPGPTAVKSGNRTVALLIPVRPIDRQRLDTALARAEALAKERDPAVDDAALAAFGDVDPINWTDDAVRGLQEDSVKGTRKRK